MSKKEFRWWFLPYCLQETEKGKYVVLNRQYKPVGIVTEEWIDYAPYAIKIKITPKVAQSLSFRGDSNTKCIYFYDDGCIPTTSSKNMKIYLERIEKIARYKVSPQLPL